MNFLNSVQLIAAFNFLLIGVLVLSNQKVLTYGVRLLGVFLVAKGVTLFTNLAFALGWTVPRSIMLIFSSALFLYAPFLYFFARYQVNRTVVNLKSDVVHLIPFLIYLLFNIVLAVTSFRSGYADVLITVAYYLQTIGYTIMAFYLLHRKGDHSKQQFWLKYLVLAFLGVWIMFLSHILFSMAGNTSMALAAKSLGVIGLLVLANLTLIIAMYAPDMFFKGFRVINKPRQEQTVLSEANYQKMLKLMSEKALYTDPNLKLADLANALGLSERNTSLIIKNYHEGNFYDFLNSFRIEEAKRLFIEKQDMVTIAEVIADVGFNSKSVFNTLFKKKVGMTPSAFKKRHADLHSAS